LEDAFTTLILLLGILFCFLA